MGKSGYVPLKDRVDDIVRKKKENIATMSNQLWREEQEKTGMTFKPQVSALSKQIMEKKRVEALKQLAAVDQS